MCVVCEADAPLIAGFISYFSTGLFLLLYRARSKRTPSSSEEQAEREERGGAFKFRFEMVSPSKSTPSSSGFSHSSCYLRGHQPRGERQSRRRGLRGVGQRRLEKGRDGGRVRAHGVDERRVGLLAIPHLFLLELKGKDK